MAAKSRRNHFFIRLNSPIICLRKDKYLEKRCYVRCISKPNACYKRDHISPESLLPRQCLQRHGTTILNAAFINFIKGVFLAEFGEPVCFITALLCLLDLSNMLAKLLYVSITGRVHGLILNRCSLT